MTLEGINEQTASFTKRVSVTLPTCTSLISFFQFFFCIEQDEGGKFVIGGHKILKYKLAAMMMK